MLTGMSVTSNVLALMLNLFFLGRARGFSTYCRSLAFQTPHYTRQSISPPSNFYRNQSKYGPRFAIQQTALFATSHGTDDGDEVPTQRKKPKSKKIKVKEITQDNIDKLAAAFDEMAKKEGFDSSTAIHADDETFEDLFEEEDFLDGDDDDLLLEDEGDSEKLDLDDILNSNNFNLDDFEEHEQRPSQRAPRSPPQEEEFDDDFLDFGGGDDDDMDARIAAAQRDMVSGRVSVPEELDSFASDASDVDLRELGFQRELNPFGDDESPRREQFKLISDAMTCPACGSDFQSRNEHIPGYLPPEKFEIQTKLSKIEDLQQLKAKAEGDEWSPEDEVEFLLQAAGGGPADELDELAELDVDALANELGLDLVELAKKKTICKRCHGLQNFGKVEENLRPGWTDEPTMSQQQFRDLLKPISEKTAVIIALVDLFDFSGSVLRELDGIAGENPVILAANKMDLMPDKMGKQRAENWVRRELEYMGVKSLANVGGAVRLVSCKTGAGVFEMLDKARRLADEMDCDVYVVGGANAGKSTLINHILGRNDDKPAGKVRAGNRNAMKGALTTSPLPGTTLKFIKVDLGDGRSMYDTPGLLVPGTITQLLTPEELKVVCPKK